MNKDDFRLISFMFAIFFGLLGLFSAPNWAASLMISYILFKLL